MSQERIALQTIPADAVPITRPQGYVVWEGPSRHDKKPICVVMTGFLRQSKNPKTGAMLQVWVLRQDIDPASAVKSGDDASVCNNCSFRASLRKERSSYSPACYVTVHYAPQAVWRAYRDGVYPHITRKQLSDLLVNHRVRGGAYGNMSNAPLWVSQMWSSHADAHTQYDHDWKNCPPGFSKISMASVSTIRQKREANSMGWRTFRVKQPHEALLPDERQCPAQPSQGSKVTCHDCCACHGTNGKTGLVNIVINDHGPTSRRFLKNRQPGLTSQHASDTLAKP